MRACRAPHVALRFALAIAALVLLGPLDRAAATTFVPMSERDLTAASDAVVIGEVTRIESALEARGGGIVTYVHLRPHSILRGAIDLGPGEEIVLRERGGRVGGRSQWVFGNPEYEVGEEVLAFLSAGADGALHTTAMALGKYHIDTDSHGRRIARRRLNRDAASFDPRSRKLVPYLAERRRSLDAIAAIARVAPSGPRPRAHVRPPELTAALDRQPHPAFTFLGSPPARWFEPDDGQLIGYYIDTNGDADLGFVGARQAMLQAFTAWSEIPTSRLALHEAGLQDPQPFGGCPDDNRLVFNDPFDEITDPMNCSGILAVGGFCTNDERRTVNDTTFRRIVTGKVTFNNGWGDCAIWTVCDLAEVATHEIGHTLGFGHSPVADATMNAVAHFDGRCGGVVADDVAAAAFSYPLTLPPSPSPTAQPSPTPTVRPGSPTRTATQTRTATRTAPPTRTRTATRTGTPTRSSTPTRSATRTRTVTAPAEPTLTATPVAVTWPSSGGWLQNLLDALRQAPR